MSDLVEYTVPTDTRSAVPCLQCGGASKSVSAHFRHHYLCDPKKAQNKRGKVIGAK